MCRIFLGNKESLGYIEEKYGVLKYLNSLEKSCGGHGNGFILVKDGKIICKAKSMELKNEQIVYTMNQTDFDWIVYHTRVASAGSKKDTNCHPYWNESGTFAFAMNGTVGDVKNLAKDLDITDTDLIYRMINKRIIGVEAVRHLGPNFMGFKDNKVWACNNGYSMGGLKYIDKDGVIAIASEFPTEFIRDTETMDEMFWWEGEKIKKKTYTPVTTTYGYGGYSWNEVYSYGGKSKLPSTGQGLYNHVKESQKEKLKEQEVLAEAEKESSKKEFDYTVSSIKKSVQKAIAALKKNKKPIGADNIYDILADEYEYVFVTKGYGASYIDVASGVLYLMSDYGEVLYELYNDEGMAMVN